MNLDTAKVMHERGQLDEAIKAYDQLLNDDFGNTDVLFLYGTALFQQGKTGLAASILRQVIEEKPTYQAAYQNLGNCFKMEHRDALAEEVFKKGLELGESADLYAAIGGMHVNNGDPQVACEYYEKALKLDPRSDLIRFNYGLALLELGEWKRGFEFYDLGFGAGNRTDRFYANLPKWDGTPGKTVILWGEQGIGDELMFASCISDAMRVCKRVIWDCHPRLTDTFKRSFNIEIHGTRKNQYLEWLPKSDADCHASITTAAMFFREKNEDFPGKPYIKPNKDKVEAYRKGAKRLRVGISWAGGIKGTRNDLRSIPLDFLRPILTQDCDFYSLQYTPQAAREVCLLEEKLGVRLKHFPDIVENSNYDKTMNFIASMDLVITVCTTVHHAAGSMGIPCWTLVPAKPAWRYGVSGDTTPWYKSVRLFRQGENEVWPQVIKRVSEELNAHIKRVS